MFGRIIKQCSSTCLGHLSAALYSSVASLRCEAVPSSPLGFLCSSATICFHRFCSNYLLLGNRAPWCSISERCDPGGRLFHYRSCRYSGSFSLSWWVRCCRRGDGFHPFGEEAWLANCFILRFASCCWARFCFAEILSTCSSATPSFLSFPLIDGATDLYRCNDCLQNRMSLTFSNCIEWSLCGLWCAGIPGIDSCSSIEVRSWAILLRSEEHLSWPDISYFELLAPSTIWTASHF